MTSLDDYLLRLEIRRLVLMYMSTDRRELHAHKNRKSIQCCCSPHRHRHEFYYRDGCFYCGACERLEPEVA